jgi:hypothetical protein
MVISCCVLLQQLKYILLLERAQRPPGKQEFRRTDFGSRLLAAEGEGVCLK